MRLTSILCSSLIFVGMTSANAEAAASAYTCEIITSWSNTETVQAKGDLVPSYRLFDHTLTAPVPIDPMGSVAKLDAIVALGTGLGKTPLEHSRITIMLLTNQPNSKEMAGAEASAIVDADAKHIEVSKVDFQDNIILDLTARCDRK